MEMQYYCQTAIQDILDHMVPIPEDFEVSGQYLHGLDNQSFIQGFKELRKIFAGIYKDMQKSPEEYGIICTSLEVNGFGTSNETMKSKRSAEWFMMLFYNLCMSGEILEEALEIHPVKYANNAGRSWVGGNKVKSAVQMIKKLQGFGFFFEGINGDKLDRKADKYFLSYPDNPDLIKILKGYILSTYQEKMSYSVELLRLDYKTLMDPALIPENQEYLDFLTFIDDTDEKIFYEKLHEGLIKNGYIKSREKVRYFAKAKDKNYTVECRTDKRKLFVGMKLKHMDIYSDFIHSLPIHIKEMFMRNSCRPECNFQGATPEKCRFRVLWHIDGMEYRKCSFEDVFVPPAYSPDDTDYYVKLLTLDKQF